MEVFHLGSVEMSVEVILDQGQSTRGHTERKETTWHREKDGQWADTPQAEGQHSSCRWHSQMRREAR